MKETKNVLIFCSPHMNKLYVIGLNLFDENFTGSMIGRQRVLVCDGLETILCQASFIK